MKENEQSLTKAVSLGRVHTELACELKLLLAALKPLAVTRNERYLGRMNLILERCERLLEQSEIHQARFAKTGHCLHEWEEFCRQAHILLDRARQLLKAKLVVEKVQGNVVHLCRDNSTTGSSDIDAMLGALDVERLLTEENGSTADDPTKEGGGPAESGLPEHDNMTRTNHLRLVD